MNKAVPVTLALLLVAVLAAEGKWSALWEAIKGSGTPNATVSTSPPVSSSLSLPNVPPTNGGSGVSTSTDSTGSGNVDTGLPLAGINAGAGAIANQLAQRAYAVQHFTDPKLNQYFYNHAATSDPTLNANWNSFIACYLDGGDVDACAAQWLPKG